MAGITQIGPEVFATTDTGVDLYWTLSLPDDDQRYPFVLIWHAGGYRTGEYDVQGGRIRSDLAQTGALIGAACEYRLAPPGKEMNTPDGLNGFQPGNHLSPGQDTVNDNGRFPKQTDDCVLAIRAAKAHARCDGRVYLLGGSAGGGHSMMMAFLHAADDDRPDLAVGCSGASYDLADPNFLLATCTQGQTCPHDACANYVGVEDTYPNPFPPESLEILWNASPAKYVSSNACPVFLIRSIPMPGGNNDPDAGDSLGIDITMNRLIDVMKSKGIVESFADVPEPKSFKQILIPSEVHAHAFNNWTTRIPEIPHGASEFIIPWLLAGPPTGNEPPPPPPDDPYPSRGWLTSSTPGATGTVPNPIRSDATTCQLTNLTPGATYTFHLVRSNKFGESKEATKIFTEDPPEGGGGGGGRTRKHSPGGLYALFNQVNGVLPNGWQDQAFWGDRTVIGSRFRTDWTALQPTETGGIDLTSIDTWLGYSVLNKKSGGLSVEAGIRTPSWVIDSSLVDSWIFADAPDPGTMPVIWNPSFQTLYGNLIRALGQAYDARPELSYIVVGGIGRVVESLVALSDDDLALVDAQAVADGFADANEAFVFGVGRMIRNWGVAFPTTPIIVPIIAPFPGAPRDPTGDEALQDLADGTFGPFPPASKLKNVGLMSEHLTTSSSTSEAAVQLIFQNALVHPAGYRFDETTDGSDSALFDATLINAEGIGAEFVEIWPEDANSTDPEYQALRELHNNALVQAAGRGGGTSPRTRP